MISIRERIALLVILQPAKNLLIFFLIKKSKDEVLRLQDDGKVNLREFWNTLNEI
jgi:hypothetical protein